MSIVVSPKVIPLSRDAAYDLCGINFEEEFEKRNTRAERRTRDVDNIDEDNVLRSEGLDEDGVAAIQDLTNFMKDAGGDIEETAGNVMTKLQEIENYVKETTGLVPGDATKIYATIIVARDNWPLLMSDNYQDKLRGGIAIMSSVAQYAALVPGGAIFAAVFPQICSFFSNFLKVAEAEKQVPETQEEMFSRVLDEAFNQEMFRELSAQLAASVNTLVDNTLFLEDCLDDIGKTSREPATVNKIVIIINTGDEFLNFFAKRLALEEGNDRKKVDGFDLPSKIANNHAKLCGDFANMMLYRMQFLLKMKIVLSFPEFNATTNIPTVNRELKHLKELYDEVFGFMHNTFLPPKDFSATLARLYLLGHTTHSVIDALGFVLEKPPIHWSISTFFNREKMSYLEAVGGRPKNNIICEVSNSSLRTSYDYVQSFTPDADGFKFLHFVNRKNQHMIFSLKLAGWVCADVDSNIRVIPGGHNPDPDGNNSDNIHHFEHERNSDGYWKFPRSGKHITCKVNKELTFTPDTSRYSDWLKDTINPTPTLFNVTNVKSNLSLMAPRWQTSPMSVNFDRRKYGVLPNPYNKNDLYYKFELKKIAEGREKYFDDLPNLYTIRNYDSGWFITARAETADLSMRSESSHAHCCMWQVEEHLWKHEKVFTIMSLAKKDDDESCQYLNGSNSTPYVTSRGELEPSKDENLLWKLESPSLASVARGVSWKCW